MKKFFSETKFRIVIALLCALTLSVFLAAVSSDGSTPVSSAVSFIMTPLEKAAVHIAVIFEDFNGYFVSSGVYRGKIEELESQLNDLRSEMVEYEKTKHKLEAYEDFLGVKEENPDFTFVPAEIIMRDTSDFYGSFTLNVGSADGVSVNDPVIYADNLIGVVNTVNQNNCTVYTLFNPGISVTAYEIRTRESCYTEADYLLSEEGLIMLSGLKKNTPVVSGGIVCTSGIGGIYPKDLIIGTVKEIRNDITGLSSYALISPSVNFTKLTDVFVITDFEGKTAGEKS